MNKLGASSNTVFSTLFISCIRYFIIFAFFLFPALGVWGQIVWGGTGTDANWNTPTNWTGGIAPIGNDNVEIPFAGVTNFPVITTDITIGSLTVKDGAIITINPTVSPLTITTTGNITFEVNSHIKATSDGQALELISPATITLSGTIGTDILKLKYLAVKKAAVIINSTSMHFSGTGQPHSTGIWVTEVKSLTNNLNSFDGHIITIDSNVGSADIKPTLKSYIKCDTFNIKMHNLNKLTIEEDIVARKFIVKNDNNESPTINLTNDVTITTTGNINLYAAKITGATKTLTLVTGLGSLIFEGAISLGANISADKSISFANTNPVKLTTDVTITTTGTGANSNITFASTITGQYKLNLNAKGDVTFGGPVAELTALIFTGDRDITLTSGNNLNAIDLYFDSNSDTITLDDNLTCNNFYFYNGKLNMTGKKITTIKDFVVFGSAYNPNDGGWAGNDTRHAYFGANNLAYKPINGIVAGNTNASFNSLDGTISVGHNFYNNGADMNPTSGWTLSIPLNGVPTINLTNKVSKSQWGIPYAVAFNMNVAYAKIPLTGGWVAAAQYPVGQNVTDKGNNVQWQFNSPQPEITEVTINTDSELTVKFETKTAVEVRSLDKEKNNNRLKGIRYNNKNLTFTTVSGTYPDLIATNVEFIATAPNTWNTDTVGNSTVNATSTNSAGIPSAITNDISFIKGAFYSQNGNTMSTGFTANSYVDNCAPVLVSIETGRDSDAHNSSNPNTPYNWHNYFQIRYSEPVNIGNASIGTPLVNFRATENYAGVNEYGGHLKETDVTVTMTGFFSYPGTFKSGITGNPVSDSLINSIYRGDSTSNPNQYGDCGIRIYAAGYSTGTPPKWVGYMSEVTDPKDKIATIIKRTDITDAEGNQLDFSIPITTVITENSTSPADWKPPIIGPSEPDTYEGREFIQIDNNRDDIIDRFEIHILDNVDGTTWDVLEDNPEDGGTDTFNKGKGLRDDSFFPGSDKSYGFKIEEYGQTPVVPSGGFDFETSVFDPIYTGGSNALTSPSDTYFSLTFNGDALLLDVRTTVIFSYDSHVGWATDLAGNLLQSVLPFASAMSVTPPIFTYTIGSVGSNKVYSKFSKAVYNQSNRANPFEPEDFSVIGTGIPNYYTIDKVIPITTENSDGEVGIDDAFFILNRPIEASHFLSIRFKPTFDALAEKSGIHMVDIHNVSDFAIGLIEPLWASDAYSNMADSGGSIRNFTSNDKLAPVDITLEATITIPSSPLPVSMYFDADVPDSVKVGNFWLPTLFPGYNLHPNIEARGLLSFQSKESLRDFLVPGGDSEIKSGNKIEFIFTVAGRYAGRLLNPDDPRSVAPWAISLQSTKQRDGVTILNNVINISRGEKTVLTLDTKKNSVFTINIFSLSGNVVKQLHKGSLPAGNYNFIWDGTNIGGRKVARGIYFIRVVGADVDEYRKVIVAKD